MPRTEVGFPSQSKLLALPYSLFLAVTSIQALLLGYQRFACNNCGGFENDLTQSAPLN
jgi:hypothetical protein